MTYKPLLVEFMLSYTVVSSGECLKAQDKNRKCFYLFIEFSAQNYSYTSHTETYFWLELFYVSHYIMRAENQERLSLVNREDTYRRCTILKS